MKKNGLVFFGVAIVIVVLYALFTRLPLVIGGEEIEIAKPYETIGLGKYNSYYPENQIFHFIDSRVEENTKIVPSWSYELCAADQNQAMSLIDKYLETENNRPINGSKNWQLTDQWKENTHYHFVVAIDNNKIHVILGDCNYFYPSPNARPSLTVGDDYSTTIGNFNYTPKTKDNFVSFIKYYYGREWSYLADEKLHKFIINDNNSKMTASFRVVLKHSGDWGLPDRFSYHNVVIALDKKTNEVVESWEKIGSDTSGKIDKKMLR